MTAEMITQMISNGMGIVLLILFMFYTLKQQREDFQEREQIPRTSKRAKHKVRQAG